jgi:CBS domain-containing protein
MMIGARRRVMSEREHTVAEIMSRRVATLNKDETLDVAEDVMGIGRIRHLPVLDEGRVIGILSQRDLFQKSLADALGYGSVTPRKLLHVIAAREVMSQPAITTSSNTTIRDAGHELLEHRIGCLPVVDDGHLVGIVTATDILRSLIDRT